MKEHIKYRSGYKYQLVDTYSVRIPIYPTNNIDNGFINLSTTGILTIKAGYAWDGASGPTIDTATSMRGALIHDALYQLLRDKMLCLSWRDKVDDILRDTCIEDGMWTLRARLWHDAVSHLAGWAASPESKKPAKIAP